jgi:hypothetical protein
LLQSNNGAATLLTVGIDTGLGECFFLGKAYIVEDDGLAPLSRKQVWGLVETINCAMDIYEADPESTAKGKRTLERWAQQYRNKTFEPPSGCGGIDIYSPRAA